MHAHDGRGNILFKIYTETCLHSLSATHYDDRKRLKSALKSLDSHIIKTIKRIYRRLYESHINVQMLLEKSVLTNISTSNKYITQYEYKSRNTHNYIKPTSFTRKGIDLYSYFGNKNVLWYLCYQFISILKNIASHVQYSFFGAIVPLIYYQSRIFLRRLSKKKKICIRLVKCLVITSFCRQIWRPDQPMNLIVWGIVGVVNDQNSTVNTCLCR